MNWSCWNLSRAAITLWRRRRHVFTSYSSTNEYKRTSKKWREKKSPIKAKTGLSAGKVLATAFWDYKDVLLINFPYDRRIHNAVSYCNILESVRAAYRSKIHWYHIRYVLLLHDNVQPHMAALIKIKLA